MPLTTRTLHVLAALLLLALGILFYHDFVYRWPGGIHSWAQSDRLSIAIMFYQNGFDFFHPQTYNTVAIDGVVGVEPPLVAYVTALLAIPFGQEAIPFIYRLLHTLLLFGSLYFTYYTVFSQFRSFALGLLVPLLLLLSPALLYYGCNFFPDTAAMSLAIIGLCQYWRWTRQPQEGQRLLWAMVWLSLGALVRTLAGTYLLAALVHSLVLSVRWRCWRQWPRQAWPGVLGAALVAAGVAWARHLNESYQSHIFMIKTNTATPEQAAHIWQDVIFKMWWPEFFAPYMDYFWLVILVLPALWWWGWLRSGLYLLLAAAGVVVVSDQVFLQFIIHEHYFFSILYPLALWALLWLSAQLGRLARYRAMPLVYLALAAYVGVYAYSGLERRKNGYYASSDYHCASELAWQKAYTLRTKIGPKDKVITLSDSGDPNLPLVYLDRRGRSFEAVPGRTADLLGWWLSGVPKDHQYLVVPDGLKNRLEKVEPNVFRSFSPYFHTPDFWVYYLP